jgi:Uma2 family endonuclease
MTADTLIPAPAVPLLRDGDRMDRDEFERRWDAMPELKHAELIEGVVSMAAALSADHGTPHFTLQGLLFMYQVQTKGVMGAGGASVRFDSRNMPQPDCLLRLEGSVGGQSLVSQDRYFEGGPELIAEIANTSKARDLGVKKGVYLRNNVREYIVWRVQDRVVDWFVLREGRYVLLQPDANGILKSEIFPGLWLDPAALIADDSAAMLRVAQLGIDSPEHTAFLAKLQAHAQPS